MSRRKRQSRSAMSTPTTAAAPTKRPGGRLGAFAAGLLAAAVIGTVGVLAFTYAAKVMPGEAVSMLYDPNSVGGLPVTDGPSGLRDSAPIPTGTVQDSDGGEMDQLALAAVNDVEHFWEQAYPGALHGAFRPIRNFVSYDSTNPQTPELCGSSPASNPNAFYCHRDRLIAWDRGQLLPAGQKYFGQMSAAALIAHEYGHAIQRMASLVNRRTPVLVFEQQADCFAGMYIRWVAEGHSPRMTISTGEGLNRVLAAAIAIRDPLITPDTAELLEEGHGTALDRITAFQMGFNTGVTACTAINIDEIDRRRGDLPIALTQEPDGDPQTANAPINEQSVGTLIELLNQIYAPTNPPKVVYKPEPCDDAASSQAPANYCPATNTISLDLAALTELGTPADESSRVLIQGDNTALSIVTSRYMLALQHDKGLTLTGSTAAMRTACMTGVANRDMSDPIRLPSGQSLQLTAGDLDEAVAGLLTNGWVASGNDDESVPAGFTRIMAFRSGLSTNTEQCYQQFP